MKNSIFLATFIGLIAGSIAGPIELTEEQKEKAKDYFDICVKQENATAEEIAKLRNRDFTNPSHTEKCISTCFFEKVGTFKDGQLQVKVLEEKFSAIFGVEKIKIVEEKCKNIKHLDRCEAGFQIFECVENARKDLESDKKEKKDELKEKE